MKIGPITWAEGPNTCMQNAKPALNAPPTQFDSKSNTK